MNVTYNLSNEHCREAVFSCAQPLRISTEWMTLYAGANKENDCLVLVQTDETNVLLHEGVHPFRSSGPEAPDHPWVFKIESPDPLIFDAKHSSYASYGVFAVHFGDDHGDVPFMAVSLLTDGTYLFRLPDGADTAAWTEHVSECVTPTVGDPIPSEKADLYDPKARRELDELLKRIAED